MKFDLICSEIYYDQVFKLIKSHGLIHSDDYDILFIEAQLRNPIESTGFYFCADKPDNLIKFLKGFASNAFLNTRMIVRDGSSFVSVDYKDIDYIAAGNNACLVYASKKYKVNVSISDLSVQLASKNFLRINKSEIVNLMQIEKFDIWISSRLIITLKNGQELVVTKSYYKLFKNTLGI